MKVIICVDDSMGLSFNNRRQSTDFNLREYLLDMVKQADAKLSVSAYSYTPFAFHLRDELVKIKPNKHILEDVSDSDFLFLEKYEDIKSLNWENVDKVILCHWNRIYPADTHLEIPDETQFVLRKTEKIKGNSHDEITIEEYEPYKEKVE